MGVSCITGLKPFFIHDIREDMGQTRKSSCTEICFIRMNPLRFAISFLKGSQHVTPHRQKTKEQRPQPCKTKTNHVVCLQSGGGQSVQRSMCVVCEYITNKIRCDTVTERKTLKSEDFQAPLNIEPVDGVDLILTGKKLFYQFISVSFPKTVSVISSRFNCADG